MGKPEKPYIPTGRPLIMLERMALDPEYEFTTREAASIMKCDFRSVTGSLEPAVRAGLLFWRKVHNRVYLRGTPFPPGSSGTGAARRREPLIPLIQQGWATDPDDPRIGKVVPGWVPPKMVCARLEAA